MGKFGDILGGALFLGITALANADKIKGVKDTIVGEFSGSNSVNLKELDEIQRKLQVCIMKLNRCSIHCNNTLKTNAQITENEKYELEKIQYEIECLSEKIGWQIDHYNEEKSKFEGENSSDESDKEYLTKYYDMAKDFEEEVCFIGDKINDIINRY